MQASPSTARPLVIQGARILTPDREIPEGSVVVREGVIRAVTEDVHPAVPAGAEVVPGRGRILVPGLVDLHLHGGGGHDVERPGGLEGAARYHAAHGTTSLVVSVAPDRPEDLTRTVERLGRGYGARARGPLPEILGLHLEGPFLDPARAGVFGTDRLCAPRPGLVEALQTASGGSVRLMTTAPELPGAMAAIREMREVGVVPCLGHTGASYEEAEAAILWGVRHVTHLFNAMAPLHHRAPASALAALLDPAVTVEVIADGRHVHPAVVEMVRRLAGPDRMVLVSDAVPAAGVRRGRFTLAGTTVTVEGERCTAAGGRLAGGTLCLGQVLARAVRRMGVPLLQAVRMATVNPARVLGLSHAKGRIAAGAAADLVMLDADLRVAAVWVAGRRVPAAWRRAAGEVR